MPVILRGKNFQFSRFARKASRSGIWKTIAGSVAKTGSVLGNSKYTVESRKAK
jgi:hypothetical protein